MQDQIGYIYNQWQTSPKHPLGCTSNLAKQQVLCRLSPDLVIKQLLMKPIKGKVGVTHGRDMIESVLLQWIYSLHKTVEIHNAIAT